jgi:hypothetical protein
MSRKARRAAIGAREIERVRRRIEQWRRKRAKRTRMPEELWAAAAALAREHGLYAAAHGLRCTFALLQVFTSPLLRSPCLAGGVPLHSLPDALSPVRHAAATTQTGHLISSKSGRRGRDGARASRTGRDRYGDDVIFTWRWDRRLARRTRARRPPISRCGCRDRRRATSSPSSSHQTGNSALGRSDE